MIDSWSLDTPDTSYEAPYPIIASTRSQNLAARRQSKGEKLHCLETSSIKADMADSSGQKPEPKAVSPDRTKEACTLISEICHFRSGEAAKRLEDGPDSKIDQAK